MGRKESNQTNNIKKCLLSHLLLYSDSLYSNKFQTISEFIVFAPMVKVFRSAFEYVECSGSIGRA